MQKRFRAQIEVNAGIHLRKSNLKADTHKKSTASTRRNYERGLGRRLLNDVRGIEARRTGFANGNKYSPQLARNTERTRGKKYHHRAR